jgi:hemolysin III
MQGNDMSNAVLKTRSTTPRKRHHDAGRNIPIVPPKSRALPVAETIQVEVAQLAAAEHPHWYRSDAYELWNALTHGAGLVMAMLGAIVMGTAVYTTGDPWRIAGCGVFVATMMAVYAASTLSHSGFASQWRTFLRRVDQGVIYLLVVGTYTPFGLAYLRTGAGWLLLVVLWTGAIAGLVSKVCFSHRLDSGLIWTYVTLGVLPTITIPWLMGVLPAITSFWMFLGGGFYLVGTIFLVNDSRSRPFHAIWHLLVIAGSACHFMGILAAVTAAG